MLNAQSSLKIAADFNSSNRKVMLTGEALFTVAKDQGKPFTIQSGELKTTVLGTSFNISTYPDLQELKIAVTSGKVKISRQANNSSDHVLSSGMTKNQILVFNPQTKTAQIKNGNAALFGSWSKDELYIENAPIADIANQLSRHFSMKVKLQGISNSTDRYTIRLGNDDVKAACLILSELTNYKFFSKNHQIYIM